MVASLKIIEKSSSKLSMIIYNFYFNFLIILRPKADLSRASLILNF